MRKEENQPEAPERKITMGSLFDGIGGFPLAAVRNGIEPVWASEIEAFHRSVINTPANSGHTLHHFCSIQLCTESLACVLEPTVTMEQRIFHPF